MENQNSISNKQSTDLWEGYYKEERITPKVGLFGAYDIFLCDSIFAKYLPFNKGKKEDVTICEIGSGDGKLLKKIADTFNYTPFGIDLASEANSDAQKKGITVIQGDAFDPIILEKHKEQFDVVYSYGFIEHISPPEKAVQIHLQMLKKGGIFFIQIPRYKGFNYIKTKIFHPELLPLHDLTIMESEILEKLCLQNGVEKLLCKNYGTFKLRLPIAKKNIRWYILKAICSLEYILNPAFRLILKDKGFETRFFSPCAIFIGRKI